MTIDEIMEMAHKLHVYEPCSLVADAERRLLELVASIEAAEREACAKLLEELGGTVANWYAKQIRARGKK